jgi:thioesterase domain-containing protein
MKDFPQSIEEIASIFIQEMCVHNPSGPYSLGGHCLGGTIAFEMARQLAGSGKKVNLLAMFDTVLQKKVAHQPASFQNLYFIPGKISSTTKSVLFKIYFESFLLRKHTRQAFSYKWNSLKKLLKRINGDKLKEQVADEIGTQLFDEASKLYAKAAGKYTLTKYNGHIELFYAKEHFYFSDHTNKIAFHKITFDEKTKNAWEEYAESVNVHDVDGEHSSIFDPAFGREFARILQQKLNGEILTPHPEKEEIAGYHQAAILNKT